MQVYAVARFHQDCNGRRVGLVGCQRGLAPLEIPRVLRAGTKQHVMQSKKLDLQIAIFRGGDGIAQLAQDLCVVQRSVSGRICSVVFGASEPPENGSLKSLSEFDPIARKNGGVGHQYSRSRQSVKLLTLGVYRLKLFIMPRRAPGWLCRRQRPSRPDGDDDAGR